MNIIQRHSRAFRIGRTTLPQGLMALTGIAALAATVGCGAQNGATVSAQPLTTTTTPQQAGSPLVVSCEPNQRTLVRPVVVNGATISQVECVSNVAAVSAQAFAPAAAPAVEHRPVRAQVDDLDDARVVTTDRPATTPRAIPARQVVYRDEVPVRSKRTVAKSAVIIGSTAGAGAGVGALIGGKKGALIGAAIGGGGATVWDQVTRRQDR
jgi:hypothetical protein